MANIPPVPKDLFDIGNRGRWFEDVRRYLNGLAVSGGLDHTLLANIGTNSHAVIDAAIATAIAHRSDGTIHFTMLDEDDMASDDNTQAATQQSIKAYIKSQELSAISETFTTTGTVGDVEVVFCNSSSAFTLTMPPIVDDRKILIKNINTGVVTIDGDGSETVGGTSTFDLYGSESIMLVAKGTDWT
jgi:hypothetical protein